MIESAYLNSALDVKNRKRLINAVAKAIKESGVEFEAIAFRGVSGALIAPSVADKLGKPLIVVRKGEQNHSHLSREGYVSARTYIIIDDCIDSGETIRKIRSGLSGHLEACFLYSQPGYSQFKDYGFNCFYVNYKRVKSNEPL